MWKTSYKLQDLFDYIAEKDGVTIALIAFFDCSLARFDTLESVFDCLTIKNFDDDDYVTEWSVFFRGDDKNDQEIFLFDGEKSEVSICNEIRRVWCEQTGRKLKKKTVKSTVKKKRQKKCQFPPKD